MAKAREMAEELAELVEKLREQQKGSSWDGKSMENHHFSWVKLGKSTIFDNTDDLWQTNITLENHQITIFNG